MKLIYILSAIVFTVFADAQNDASRALNQFAIKFLEETSNMIQETNVALSPYTVWNVMSMFNDGARGNTANQLETVLGIPKVGTTRDTFRSLQKRLADDLKKNDDGVTLDILNAIYTRKDKTLNLNYQNFIQTIYKANVEPLDFDNAVASAEKINSQLAIATQGRVNDMVTPMDLNLAQIFTTSAMFFKGLWDNKFNVSDTKKRPFYNERNQLIAEIPMMYNKDAYPYSLILNDRATAVELPYKGKNMAMVLILPKMKVPLQSIIKMLSERSFSEVLVALKRSKEIFGSDNVVVYVPKFEINSQLNLNFVLNNMGMVDIFQAHLADLSTISPDHLFLSRVIHKAQIQVDEEGTIASSVTTGTLENKIPAPVFEANRPFLFFVYDKTNEAIVFMGKHSSPTNIKSK